MQINDRAIQLNSTPIRLYSTLGHLRYTALTPSANLLVEAKMMGAIVLARRRYRVAAILKLKTTSLKLFLICVLSQLSPLPKYTQLRVNLTTSFQDGASSFSAVSNLFALTDIATASFLSTLYGIPKGLSVKHGSNQSVAEFYGEVRMYVCMYIHTADSLFYRRYFHILRHFGSAFPIVLQQQRPGDLLTALRIAQRFYSRGECVWRLAE